MDDRLYLIDLYDLYKDLLTKKQCECFEKYYFEDLTLSEISEELSVSRAYIAKSLKITKEKLNGYEKTLKKCSLKKYIYNLKDNKLKNELEKFL